LSVFLLLLAIVLSVFLWLLAIALSVFLWFQTWFYEDNKKAEIGNQKYWIYYKKGIVTVKSGIKKAEFHFKADENQVCDLQLLITPLVSSNFSCSQYSESVWDIGFCSRRA
jgi:hypothetical protein